MHLTIYQFKADFIRKLWSTFHENRFIMVSTDSTALTEVNQK